MLVGICEQVEEGRVGTSFKVDFDVIVSCASRDGELVRDVEGGLAEEAHLLIGAQNIVSEDNAFRERTGNAVVTGGRTADFACYVRLRQRIVRGKADRSVCIGHLR